MDLKKILCINLLAICFLVTGSDFHDGAGLATSGCLLQSLSRNGLADPGILGIKVWAGIMVVLLYHYLPTISVTNPSVTIILSFIGAFLVALLICWLATNKDKGLSSLKIILMGIAIAVAGNVFILVTSLRLNRAPYCKASCRLIP